MKNSKIVLFLSPQKFVRPETFGPTLVYIYKLWQWSWLVLMQIVSTSVGHLQVFVCWTNIHSSRCRCSICALICVVCPVWVFWGFFDLRLVFESIVSKILIKNTIFDTVLHKKLKKLNKTSEDSNRTHNINQCTNSTQTTTMYGSSSHTNLKMTSWGRNVLH